MPINEKYYDYNDNISIGDIQDYFKGKYSPGFDMFEVGLDNLRFDLIRVNPYKQYVRIFEFKSCRQDFIRDKKWHKYRQYCHTFTFACPPEVIKKADLIPEIGLLWVYNWKHKDHDSWRLDGEWKQRPKKYDVNPQILLKLAFVMVKRMMDYPSKVFCENV